MTRQLDDYEVANACDSTRSFLDVLSNWYIRRSRERFWAADGDVDAAAFDTLYTVLEIVCRVTAPLLPLTTEEVWRGLTGERSVHLTDWPSADDLPADDALVAAMDQVRDVCSAGSALRKGAGAAQPAAAVDADRRGRRRRRGWPGFEAIVADELNVKAVRLLDADAPRRGVVRRLAAAHRQRPRRRPAARQGRADRDQGLEVRRLVGGRRRRRSPPAGWSLRGGRVHPRDRRRSGGDDSATGMLPAAASWCSTPRSRPSSRPRASPATWSAPSSRPAATPASTSPTGSR